jgi:CRP/FNR family transcriptional regulator, anaerobic regulatory protein
MLTFTLAAFKGRPPRRTARCEQLATTGDQPAREWGSEPMVMHLMQAVAPAPPYPTGWARLIDSICEHGECTQLPPQQRVLLPPADGLIILREGVLALDAMAAKGKLQVLDFLVAGDAIAASMIIRTPGASLRAITSAALVSFTPSMAGPDVSAHDYWELLFAQCQSQLARSHAHKLVIGRLETEARVASFLLAMAQDNLQVWLPMSRTDIANYLVMNCDTLSRTMMRFSHLGLIRRVGRHAVRITDVDGLRKKSSVVPLLAGLFGMRDGLDGSGLARRAEADTSVASTPTMGSSCPEHNGCFMAQQPHQTTGTGHRSRSAAA